jgi:site-specific recombinase XerD
LEGLSANSIKTYRSEFNQFLYYAGNKPVIAFVPEDLRTYMANCLSDKNISTNTAHSRLNALKAYYEKVLKREKFFYDIPRPKKPKTLPKVLSEEELNRLFSSVTDLKYKAILFTAYSAGLRVSELCGLRLEDVDRDRMELFIYRAKGDKDRLVPLSPLVADILKKHLEMAKKKPLKFVFEGDIPGQELSHNAASNAFKKAKSEGEILKSVTFHSLRHSFATHMLEKGVSTRYIQELLGHFSIKTTEIYLHVARTKLINLPSPLDDLWLKGGLEF